MASATAEAASSPAAPAPAKRGPGLVPMLAVVLLSVGGAGGVSWYMVKHAKAPEGEHGTDAAAAAEAEKAKLPAPAAYLSLDPPFVVNLESADDSRYLQTEIQLMGRDPVALEAAKTHLPRIRNALLMLLSQQAPADLATREGKEKLQQAALSEVQKVLEAETGKPVVEAVYFTSFVMQ